MPNSAMKIICIKLNEIEDIPEKPLYASKNYTLVEFSHRGDSNRYPQHTILWTTYDNQGEKHYYIYKLVYCSHNELYFGLNIFYFKIICTTYIRICKQYKCEIG